MRRQNLSAFIEGALMIGIATILSFIKVFQAPYGGSVTLGSMVPIILYSVRHGAAKGVLAGTVYGLLQLVIEPYIVHPAQVILDYPLAFGLLGLAGLFGGRIYLGIPAGILGRFLSHLLSGVIFFASYAPEGMNALVYSAIYNGSYLLPELVISLLAVRFVLYRFIRKNEGSGDSG
ncbi:energy-coupled thiamine transporter ThiT [Thermosediminibacter litoriperuensis]|uniref:Thiamine transporter n=1 Tax=Thermosediminibacter litoriperuensis TaxID=291989 RepID=A0A5S5AYH8_9FIRM|nr:energy-coupled thiamine transporter ThiT [Thermosediminibacter litoriperuensis]TYP57836.1 thiamine transporter [Thermosediminibacter litoriperuensis]